MSLPQRRAPNVPIHECFAVTYRRAGEALDVSDRTVRRLVDRGELLLVTLIGSAIGQALPIRPFAGQVHRDRDITPLRPKLGPLGKCLPTAAVHEDQGWKLSGLVRLDAKVRGRGVVGEDAGGLSLVGKPTVSEGGATLRTERLTTSALRPDESLGDGQRA